MDTYTKLIDKMKAHALHDYPRECVGIITNDFDYVPCKNLSSTPLNNFYLDPAALVKYDGNTWGIFHSHPGEADPIPSKEDKFSSVFKQFTFLVGFNEKFYTYWFDSNVDALKFEEFGEKHLVSNS